jgi:signal transduction histidine kinase
MSPTEIIDVHATLRTCAALLRRTLGSSVQLTLRFEAPASRVRLQRGQLEQIVTALVENARHAMPEGGELTILTQIDPWGVERPDGSFGELIIEVTDTGVGIPVAIIDRIFDPHFTTRAPGQGTGLGLPAVHQIVTEAGGHVIIRSAVGAGTTFEIRFPLA